MSKLRLAELSLSLVILIGLVSCVPARLQPPRQHALLIIPVSGGLERLDHDALGGDQRGGEEAYGEALPHEYARRLHEGMGIEQAEPRQNPAPKTQNPETKETQAQPQPRTQNGVPALAGQPGTEYAAYRVKPGDTLASIALAGGSEAELIGSYNRLKGQPQPGRELIVPQIAGRASALPEASMLVVRGNTARPWVAFTFDCELYTPSSYGLLDTLRAAGVRATFFVLGDTIGHDPALLRRMVEDGHELGSHGLSHANFTTLSAAQISYELTRTEQIVRELAGPEITLRPFMRFPYGAHDQDALKAVIENGYLPIDWTLDVLDWGTPKTPEFIAERALNTLPREELAGAIIVSHCSEATIAAMPAVLRGLAERGLELRTISDVLGP